MLNNTDCNSMQANFPGEIKKLEVNFKLLQILIVMRITILIKIKAQKTKSRVIVKQQYFLCISYGRGNEWNSKTSLIVYKRPSNKAIIVNDIKIEFLILFYEYGIRYS